jgi:hypothetical protein
MCGGGGGGASAIATTQTAVGGGGSGGGCSESLLTANLNLPLTYTVGALGAGGGVGGANDGADGGTTTFTLNGVTKTAYGGRGGKAMFEGITPTFSANVGNLGASTGDIAWGGSNGLGGMRLSVTDALSGCGGNSVFGSGGRGFLFTSAGCGALGYGGGGGGGAIIGANASGPGGNGTGGIIVITEYY